MRTQLISALRHALQGLACLGIVLASLNAPALAQTEVCSTYASGLATDAEGDLFIAQGPGPGTGNSRLWALLSGYESCDVAGGTYYEDAIGAALLTRDSLETPWYVLDYGSGGYPSTVYATGSSFFPVETSPGVYTTIDGNPMSYAAGPAVDSSGNVYVVDGNNGWLYQVTDADGDFNLIVGQGTTYPYSSLGYDGDGQAANPYGSFYSPDALAIDSWGNLYVADGNCIREVYESSSGPNPPNISSPTVGYIYTIAGTHSSGDTCTNGDSNNTNGLAATFNTPMALTVDSYGNVYVADTGNNLIRKITQSTGAVSTVYGNGDCGEYSICEPTGIVIISGQIYYSNSVYGGTFYIE